MRPEPGTNLVCGFYALTVQRTVTRGEARNST